MGGPSFEVVLRLYPFGEGNSWTKLTLDSAFVGVQIETGGRCNEG